MNRDEMSWVEYAYQIRRLEEEKERFEYEMSRMTSVVECDCDACSLCEITRPSPVPIHKKENSISKRKIRF